MLVCLSDKQQRVTHGTFTSYQHHLFLDFWKTRDESKNFNQRHEVELIKEEKRKAIEAEIRLQVVLEELNREWKKKKFCGVFFFFKLFKNFFQIDEQMRRELAEWKLAVDKDKGSKPKASTKVMK